MMTEQQQEQASLYVLGALLADERQIFEAELRSNDELRELTHSLQRTTGFLALTSPPVAPSAGLRDKVLKNIESRKGHQPQTQTISKTRTPRALPGFLFHGANDPKGWKQLPVPGAWIKLLSLERERGYAVLLGRLEPGVRYPAHQHEGGEELYILTGDLHIGDRALVAGDFHHADAGTAHGVNYSVEGCTLLAVLPAEHELVQFAMA